jgi:uncharacterized protein with FMN-binding domain
MGMKKLLLSLGVIAVFTVYSLVERHQATGIVLTPSTATPNQPPSSPGTGSGSSTTTANQSSANSSSSASSSTQYKDGTYTGPSSDAFYGNVKVAVTISGGKIIAVTFLDHPSDNPNSIDINQQAMPFLQQEAIKAQSANVNIISGATDTSQAFIQSLTSALSQAM